MSDHDRGPYTPPSDRLAFDPREPVRSRPAPVTLIVSALVLLGVVGGVAFIYRHGVRHPGAGPATVGAPMGQIKSAAPPDTANDAVAGLTIDKSAGGNAVAFAPPPEEPTSPQSAPLASIPAQPAPTPAAAALPPAPVVPQPPPKVVVAPAPAAQPATPAKPVKAAKPQTIASLIDAAADTRPKPTKLRPAVATTTASAPAVADEPPAGASWVQIGAFSSAALADKGWSDAAKLAPASMHGKGKKVEVVSHGGKTFYRTYVTGFKSRADAEGYCATMSADGKPCFVK